jgi:CDP-diacylglycerol--glycerol-3-phosphate 3-phosphatidyltransferase
MNLPNTLTVARIFLVPLLVSVLLTKFEGRLVMGLPVELVAAAIFGIASLTDWLDGLSRAAPQAGHDPRPDPSIPRRQAADLRNPRLAGAAQSRAVGMVAVIIGREIAVTGLRNLAYSRGLTMPASGLGKIKMASQVTAILLLILGWERVPLLVWAGRRRCGCGAHHRAGLAFDYYQGFQRAMLSRGAKVADFENREVGEREKKSPERDL